MFVDETPLGDPIVLAAGLSPAVPDLLLGVRLTLAADGRHPALLARELTSLDLVCGGRSVLCFTPPFDDRLAEAVDLCRALWRDGEATSEGPHFPVAHVVNRPRPAGAGSPRLALDLTGGGEAPAGLVGSGGPAPAPDRRPGRLSGGAPMTDVTLVHELPGRQAETTAVTGHHLPALNGLRAVAVIGVVAYHLQLGWASGGYLGVDLFFVLSGFLITTLLLEEWAGSGRISLADFWGRRARRLLPALFMVVGALGLYLIANAIWGGPGANGLIDLSGLRGDAISTLLYVNNWHSIFVHQSYFAQFSTPSPLQHTWSLAIEEQFYLVWPLVLLLLLRVARRGWRRAGMILTVTLGVASSVLMAVLFHPGSDPTRVYFGTDTRLFDLMAGATIAFAAASRPQPRLGARRTLHVVAPLAAIALAVFWVRAGTPGGLPTNFMFEGGFLLCAVLAGLVVADARLTEPGAFSRALAWRPLHFIGTISYGIYLWHWPVIVYLNGARTGLSAWPLDLLRVAVTLLVSTASYYLVERPVRLAHARGWVRWWAAPIAGVLTAVLIVVATIPAVADPSSVVGTTHLPVAATGAAPSTVPGAGGYGGQKPIRLTSAPTTADPLRVMLLGDSVMHDASYGITAALESTGEATVATRTIDGFGLVAGVELAHLHPRPHPPDGGPAHRGLVELGPVRPGHAQRPAPAGAVHQALAPRRGHHALPGQRCRGGDLHPVPRVGRPHSPQPRRSGRLQQGALGRRHRLERHRREDDGGLPRSRHVLPAGQLHHVGRDQVLGVAPARGRPQGTE